MTPEPPGETSYTTRSGRQVRRVERYEPDEDTIFVDEEYSDSDYEHESDISGHSDLDDSDTSVLSEEETDSTTSESSINNSSDDESTVSEDDVDVLNWDTLTIDAESEEESEEESDEDE